MGSGSSKQRKSQSEPSVNKKSKTVEEKQTLVISPPAPLEEKIEKEIPWTDILNLVAKEDLWNGVRRPERQEWANYVQQAADVSKKAKSEIPQNVALEILVGDLHHSHKISESNKVLVFISSTFTDTKAERDNLIRDVYPFVRMVCRHLGLSFGTVDMRWGVTEEAVKDHSVVDLCLNEIQRCLKESCGPAFLGIVTNKYGYRPLPSGIERSEFETMMAYLINNNLDTELMKSFYRLDKNSVEQEYVLVPMTDDTDTVDWWNKAETLQNQMREVAAECFDMNADTLQKYFISVTENEIQDGVLKNQKKHQQAVLVQRELNDIESGTHRNRKILDMKNDEMDEYAQGKLKELKVSLKSACDDMPIFSYEEATVEGCRKKVRSLCDYVCKTLLEKIFHQFSKRAELSTDPVLEEIIQHHSQVKEKSSLFVGKDKEVQAVHDYLQNSSTEPFVVHGQSGCGKTTLLAVAANKAKSFIANCVLVIRFLGTTSHSGSVSSLLFTICIQITRAYEKCVSDVPSAYKELTVYFKKCLEYATKDMPLILFLDSLDQLSNEDLDQSLTMLLLGGKLPEHVKVVTSTLPGTCLSTLKDHLSENQFVEVNKLLPAEGPEILSRMLASKGRQVHNDQLSIIMESFVNCPLPMYLRLAADIACRWRSYDTVTTETIAADARGMITILFERLESKYGGMFVHHALAYITAAKDGLAETELEDILSCDDEVLDSIFKWWVPPIRCIPVLLWTRVRSELGQYLVERGSDRVKVYRWYHRQFWETAADRYLDQPFGSDLEPFRKRAHTALTDFFEGKWANGKIYPDKGSSKYGKIEPKLEPRGVSQQPIMFNNSCSTAQDWNKRKLYELPYHILKNKDWNKFLDLVSNLQYIEGKFAAGFGYDCYRELTEASKMSGLADLKMIARFVGCNLAFLQHEPSCVYQLAAQQLMSSPMRKSVDQLASGDLPYVIIRDKEDTKDDCCELTLQGHKKGIYSCDFSRNGDFIVSTSEDGSLCVWDAVTGEDISTISSLPLAIEPGEFDSLDMITHHVNPCCFSPTDDVIASGTEAGEIIMWNTTGTQIKKVHTENEQVTFVKFSPDKAVLASSFIDGKVYIWNAETLDHTHTVQLEHSATGLDFSPDGSVLAVSCIPGLALIDTSTYTILSFVVDKPHSTKPKQRRSRVHKVMVLCCKFHPSGKQVMTGSADSHIGIWDAKTGECTGKLGGHSAWIWSIQFTKDGQHMYTASSDRSIGVWKYDDDNWKYMSAIYGHSHRITTLALDPNTESVLVTGSLDCTLKLWNIASAKVEKQSLPGVENQLLYNTLAISSSGDKLLMSEGWSSSCEVKSVAIGNMDCQYVTCTPNHIGYIKKADFLGDGSRVIVLDHGHGGDFAAKAALKAQVIVSDATQGREFNVLAIKDDDENIEDGPTAFGVGQNYIVIGTFTGAVMLYDLTTYQKVKVWHIEDEVTTVACSLKDNHVVTTTGCSATLWKVSDADVQCIKGPLSTADSKITTSAFSPLGHLFAIGLESGTVNFWRIMEDGVVLAKTVEAHTSFVKDMKFSNSGTFLATCGAQNVRIWDAQGEIKMRSSYYAPVNCVAFIKDDILMAGDATGKLHQLTL